MGVLFGHLIGEGYNMKQTWFLISMLDFGLLGVFRHFISLVFMVGLLPK